MGKIPGEVAADSGTERAALLARLDSLLLRVRERIIDGMTPEERSRRAAEVGLDAEYPWATWVLAESKTERRRRQGRNGLAILGSMVRRAISTPRALLAAPQPRSTPRARAPRSRRSTVASRSRSPGSKSGDDDQEPPSPLDADRRRFLRASMRLHAHVLRRSAAKAVA